MAQNVYARAANRGFPVADVSGQTGVGALQDSTAPTDQPVGSPTAAYTDPNVDPANTPTTLAPPEDFIQGLSLWGLPGSMDPDNTPRTNAAPMADFTLPLGEYYAEVDATHSEVFSGVALNHPGSSQSWVGTEQAMQFDQTLSEGNGQTDLAEVPDAMKGQAGLDSVQGWGGGGQGPGGTNLPQLTTLDRDFPGPEGQVQFLNADEVPFMTVDAVQFIASDPGLSEWTGGGWDVPTANVSAQQPIGTDIPAQGPALQEAQPASVGSFWGG